MFFRPKPPVDHAEYEWLLACFAWLRAVLDDADIKPALVLPNNPQLLAATTGPEMFEAVRSIMQMQEWPCRLELNDDDFDPGDPRVEVESAGTCGTFSVENGEAVIRYSSIMLRDPNGLAATFAHELCHYLLMSAGDPPGGPDLMEHSTDCAAAYCGFGVLLANNARRFSQWQSDGWSGWQSSANGYLSEAALATATAMYVQLHGHPSEMVEGAFKSYLRKDFRKASKAIAKDHPDLTRSLTEIDLTDWSFS